VKSEVDEEPVCVSELFGGDGYLGAKDIEAVGALVGAYRSGGA
jgi:hypothetical protein